jgi:Fe-S cluster biogenesis protein NfuA
MTLNKKNIETILTERIVPLLELDHGSLEVVQLDYDDGNLQVRFGGSYRGSPCRETLLKYVVEPVLREEFSDLNTVEWID